MKKPLALASAVLALTVISACSGSGGSSSSGAGATTTPAASTSSSADAAGYCDQLQAVQNEISALSATSLSDDQFSQIVTEFDGLSKSAPAGVAESWTTLHDSLAELQGIVHDAGLTMGDLSAVAAGQAPPGMSQAELKDLTTKLQTYYSSNDASAASTKIEASAKADCGIDLAASASPSSSSGGGVSTAPSASTPAS